MPTPAADLFPGPTLFPGSAIPVVVGGYAQPIECALDSLVLTAQDEFGVDWVAEKLTGWWGSPGSTLQLTSKERAPGAWAGPREYAPRSIVIDGFTEAPDPAAAEDAMTRLKTAAALDARILTVSRDTVLRSAIVYRQDEVLIDLVGDTIFDWSVHLSAPDPRKFTAPLVVSTALPSAIGGLVIPFTVPFSINSTVVSGTCSLTNPGNTNGPVVLRIAGPITGPRVTHVGSGRQLVFDTSLVLAAGEWIDVDMEAQTVLANGQASRNGWVTSRGWSGFEPGENEWAFAAVSGSGRLTVTATPAWD